MDDVGGIETQGATAHERGPVRNLRLPGDPTAKMAGFLLQVSLISPVPLPSSQFQCHVCAWWFKGNLSYPVFDCKEGNKQQDDKMCFFLLAGASAPPHFDCPSPAIPR